MGGGHELGIRSGTVNVPGAVGFAEAVKVGQKNIASLSQLLNYFWNKLKAIPNLGGLNGPMVGTDQRLSKNLSVWWKGCTGDGMTKYLSRYGVFCSTGSACSSITSGGIEASHVLLAVGRSESQAKATCRFSISKFTTEQDLDICVSLIQDYFRELEPKKDKPEGTV